MNVVLIIPTGIGCEIGGHAGDANPVARLLGSVCDKLVLHPNVVNASDINEMPENSLYVEGSILDRFLEGEIELYESPIQNRILVAVNKPVRPETINAVSAARATLGVDAKIIELKHLLVMRATMTDRGASGDIFGWEELIEQVEPYKFEALAISSFIDCEKEVSLNYFRNAGINPWGGVEAKLSKLVSTALNKPAAHAPQFEWNVPELVKFNEVVDPRESAELLSLAFLHCVLKGLHRAPRIGPGLSVRDVDCLITPVDCVGRPHWACMKRGIPIIAVKENKCCLHDVMPEEFILVENYLEAAGLIAAMGARVNYKAVRRPLEPTEIY